ncbi:Glucokinase [Symmachiella dynata]|uniref:ROK family protein n=1 Tax=Symmachiella dynata TaxID=2527995 RepID=UPI00118C9FEC|nr:ROK family protein [Symmachiella dynata]QDT51954.1 Glucokinase [Symmachiella dynata]
MTDKPAYALGVEIGGTKLQIGLGTLDSETIEQLWRADIDATQGAERIRTQIAQGVDELLKPRGLQHGDVAGMGIGFGGPVDADRGCTMTSHQVAGWDDFPIVDWAAKTLGIPGILQNDADTAALAEAHYGAGRGFDPVFYITVGSGIGGGLILGGQVYRGSGRGAAEIGHLRPGNVPRHLPYPGTTVEQIASGFGITQRARQAIADHTAAASFAAAHRTAAAPEMIAQAEPSAPASRLLELTGNDPEKITTKHIATAAAAGDPFCRGLLNDATDTLGWAIAQVVTLVNPARIVIGGGVSLMGDTLFFEPVGAAYRKHVFAPFADVAQIVPAALGEEVVIHGALALARDTFS